LDELWIPGSDGSFLHMAASEDVLNFQLLPAIKEIGIVLGWSVEVQ
jgi:hypothetical protein